MMLLHDRASTTRALTSDLDPKLRALLERRVASLVTPHGDLTDWTEFLIVQPGDTEAEIVFQLGFSPMFDPLSGARFGDLAFEPGWDWLILNAGFFEMIVTFGSTFAYILLIEDTDGVSPDLLALCRRYAGGRP